MQTDRQTDKQWETNSEMERDIYPENPSYEDVYRRAIEN